jgi:pentatricopeptide repeat protein
MAKVIQSWNFGGQNPATANWWTNTSPSRAQLAAGAALGNTGMLQGAMLASSPLSGYGGNLHTGTFSNFATQKALAGQHNEVQALYEKYQAAVAMGDVDEAEKILKDLRKYGFDPDADRPIFHSPYTAVNPTYNPGQSELLPAAPSRPPSGGIPWQT